MSEPYEVFVGIDWGQESHQVSVSDQKGDLVGERSVPHRGDALVELSDWLLTFADGDVASIAVALEVPRGPIVDTLLERGYHVFSINPKQLDRFRDRYSVAGAKDDRRDARVLGNAIRTDPKAFRPLTIDDPLTIQLREYSRHDVELGEDFSAQPTACGTYWSGLGPRYSHCPLQPTIRGCGGSSRSARRLMRRAPSGLRGFGSFSASTAFDDSQSRTYSLSCAHRPSDWPQGCVRAFAYAFTT